MKGQFFKVNSFSASLMTDYKIKKTSTLLDKILYSLPLIGLDKISKENWNNPYGQMGALMTSLNYSASFLMAIMLYGTGVLETKSFNPLPIINHYQEISKQNILEIKMRGKISGDLENSISIRDLFKAD